MFQKQCDGPGYTIGNFIAFHVAVIREQRRS